ncbi:hypothetical protein Moror_812 [Moniliophthora roreri MCA 2997]|uniref:MARVEL domain-containing protein n=1 Tax=Moniliophthora roreri (strain MCA 2997) TaxID=1381753 RepID=V2X819_MONRO|nr:hypothetical protein Moror_812 [Moniliophthora roreri MCA 2997]
MSPLSLTRVAVYGLAIVFGIIVMALNADVIATSREYEDYVVFDFQGLGIAVGILNILILPAFLTLGMIRKNAFLTANVVELPVIGVLTILWIVESALITQIAPPGGFQCDTIRRFSFTGSDPLLKICQEVVAIQAISFLTWVLLLIYVIFTIGMCATGKAGWQGEAQAQPAPATKTNENTTYATGA